MTKVNTQSDKSPLIPHHERSERTPLPNNQSGLHRQITVSDGYDTILTITDHDVRRRRSLSPVTNSRRAGVATLYATHVFPHYGLPKKVISDTKICRLNFLQKLMRHQLCRDMTFWGGHSEGIRGSHKGWLRQRRRLFRYRVKNAASNNRDQ